MKLLQDIEVLNPAGRIPPSANSDHISCERGLMHAGEQGMGQFPELYYVVVASVDCSPPLDHVKSRQRCDSRDLMSKATSFYLVTYSLKQKRKKGTAEKEA